MSQEIEVTAVIAVGAADTKRVVVPEGTTLYDAFKAAMEACDVNVSDMRQYLYRVGTTTYTVSELQETLVTAGTTLFVQDQGQKAA